MTGDAGAARGLRRREWARRVGWLVAYWAGGVAVVGVVAYGLRGVMRWVGLGT
jgi:hypothetical protein